MQTPLQSDNWSKVGIENERELKLKDEIRQRLQTICGNMTTQEFEELVEKILRNQLKGEIRPFRFGSSWKAAAGVKALKPGLEPHGF